MDFKTPGGRSAVILSLFCFLFFNSCRKELREETVVTIRCVTPHNGEGVAGCKVIIYEIKSKKDFSVTGNIDGDVTNTYSGITDQNGNATIRFHYMRKNKYQYKLAYDYSGIQQPNGMNQIQVELPLAWSTYLDKNKFDYSFTFNVLGFCGVHTKFENVNCYNSSDELRYDAYNLSKHEGEGAAGPDIFYGCGVVFDVTSSSTSSRNTGKYVYKLFITRNGETHIQYDTVNLQPGIMNEAIIEY